MGDTASPKAPPPAPDDIPGYHHFFMIVMSDVYALLDFLSSRDSPSLIDSVHVNGGPRQQSGQSDRSEDPLRTDSVKADSKEQGHCDQSDLSRAMRIGKQIAAANGDICATDAAFLIRYRDRLNIGAAPATGSSISFTMRVIERLLGKTVKGGASGYIIPDPQLDDAALTLAKFVDQRLRCLLMLLILTITLSTYIAFGKLLLDTRDAVNRDFGANLTSIVAEFSLDPNNEHELPGVSETNRRFPNQIPDPLIDEFCRLHKANILVGQSCHQRDELKERKQNIHDLLGLWVWPYHSFTSGETLEQWAATAIGIIGNYLLPVFYGWLGAMASVLRRLNMQLAEFLLTPRDLRASRIRVILGTVTGACIGLFVNSSTGAATLSGIGGAAVTLSASGIAFLAGYGVEAVFKMLDALMNNVFKIDEERKHAFRGRPSSRQAV